MFTEQGEIYNSPTEPPDTSRKWLILNNPVYRITPLASGPTTAKQPKRQKAEEQQIPDPALPCLSQQPDLPQAAGLRLYLLALLRPHGTAFSVAAAPPAQPQLLISMARGEPGQNSSLLPPCGLPAVNTVPQAELCTPPSHRTHSPTEALPPRLTSRSGAVIWKTGGCCSAESK